MSKKFLAIVLAATMVVGSTVTAFASDTTSGGTGTKLADYGTTTIDGTGSAEGLVNTHLYRVVLPVIPASSLNYTIDPQGLVKETAGKAYGEGVTVGDGNVFFKNHETLNATTEGTITGVSGETDKFSVENKSTFPITVTVKTKATAAAGTGDNLNVALATSATPAAKEIYLAFKDNAKKAETAAALTNSEQEFATVLGDASAAYKYDYASNAYTYTFDSTGEYDFAKYEFQYVAAVDVTDVTAWTIKTAATTTADAVRYDAIVGPTINVLYKLDEYVAPESGAVIDIEGPAASADADADADADAAPNIATTSYTAASNTPVEITVSLGSGSLAATGITSITYLNKAGAVKTVEASTGYTFSDNKITLTAATVNAFVDSSNTTREYTITFNDDAGTAKTVTLTK